MPLTVELDRSSPVPLYYQLAQAIEAAIRDGELAPGDRFENELALAKRLTLSRPTTRRAIQELVDKGLLVRKRGVGTQVVQNPVHRRVELTSLFDDLAPRRPGADHAAARLPRRAARRRGCPRTQPGHGPRGGVDSSAALRQRRTARGDDQPSACRDRAGRRRAGEHRAVPVAASARCPHSARAPTHRRARRHPCPRPGCSTRNPTRRCSRCREPRSTTPAARSSSAPIATARRATTSTPRSSTASTGTVPSRGAPVVPRTMSFGSSTMSGRPGPVLGEHLYGQLNRVARYRRRVLVNCGQIDARVVRQAAVVVADQRKFAGHLDSCAGEHVEQSECTSVVAGEDCGRQRAFGEHRTGSDGAGLLVVRAGNHFGVARESVIAHRGAVGATTIGGSGVRAPVDMVDVAVAELDEIAHRLAHPLRIIGAHRRQVLSRRGRGAARRPPRERGRPGLEGRRHLRSGRAGSGFRTGG